MWVPNFVRTSRVIRRRRFFMLFAPLLAAGFMSVFFATPALAADAEWRGKDLYYGDNKLETVIAPPNQDDKPNEYEWRSGSNPTKANVVYIGENPEDATSATLITYTVSNGQYSSPSASKTISIERNPISDGDGAAQTTAGSTCQTGGGMGWIICPVSNWLAEGIDAMYGIIEKFLEVQTIRGEDSSVYIIWKVFRTIANICFILVFLAVIYSQLTGAGFSNYNIKTILPRLIAGAILLNLSFEICAIAVDVSNVLGYSIQAILSTIRENTVTNADVAGDSFGWTALTTFILSAGAVGGYMGLAGATGLAGGSMSYLLLAALIPVGFAVLIAFVILAARQALIVVLTIIAPLAFVAFVLPGTKQWYDRWQKGFTTLLVFFPVFALLFGGSQLAGTAIINSSVDAQDAMKLPIVLIGMATMVAPLVITPFLIRFSSGLLGQIANMTNNKSRGFVDRSRNWALDNADMHKQRKVADSATRHARLQEKLQSGQSVGLKDRVRGRRTAALRMDQGKRRRESYKKNSEETLANLHGRDWERRLNSPAEAGGINKLVGRRSLDQRTHDQHAMSHHLHKQQEGEKALNDAAHEQHWARHLEANPGSHDRDLQRRAYNTQQTAKQLTDIVEGETKASWDRDSTTDAALQSLRLRATSTTDNAQQAEQEWNLLVDNIRTKGNTTPGVANSASAQQAAQEIQDLFHRTQETGSAQDVAKTIQQIDFAKNIETNAAAHARATGIGGEEDAARVLARAKSTVSKAYIEDAKSIQNTMGYEEQTNPTLLMQQFTSSQDIPVAKRLAMVWAAAQNGNFGYETSRQMIDWYVQNGGDNGGRPTDAQLLDFKELVRVESSINDGDRALELFLADGRDLDRTLSDYTNDMGTWNINTSRFAKMGETRQLEAIKVWRNSGKDGQKMLRMVTQDIGGTPTLMSSIKGKVKAELGFSVSDDELDD